MSTVADCAAASESEMVEPSNTRDSALMLQRTMPCKDEKFNRSMVMGDWLRSEMFAENDRGASCTLHTQWCWNDFGVMIRYFFVFRPASWPGRLALVKFIDSTNALIITMGKLIGPMNSTLGRLGTCCVSVNCGGDHPWDRGNWPLLRPG